VWAGGSSGEAFPHDRRRIDTSSDSIPGLSPTRLNPESCDIKQGGWPPPQELAKQASGLSQRGSAVQIPFPAPTSNNVIELTDTDTLDLQASRAVVQEVLDTLDGR
jgi:hypothetical protein